MIYKILGNNFYYGEFEYPKSSGNWYQGNHQPIITKDLFLKVQEQLKVPIKSKWGAKEFPYKQFMKCYSCGSSIVGEEKTKNTRDGTSRTYVYYHCSPQVDYSCKEPFITEHALSNEIIRISDEIIDGIKEFEPGLIKAMEKFKLIALHTSDDQSGINLNKLYVTYVVKQGSFFEKSRLIRNISASLTLHSRQLVTIPRNPAVDGR